MREAARLKTFFVGLCIALGLLGIFVRFYQITQNQFVYYDEGMWLGANREFVAAVTYNPPHTFNELVKILQINLKLSLATAKALWLFLLNLRGFWGGVGAWYFPRMISAILGSLTLVMTFFLAKRLSQSWVIGWAALALLAILPSHVYYSRLGLQEALSTFCFIAGLYLYLFPRLFHYQTFCSALILSLAFLANYRMIIIPILIGFTEVFISLAEKTKIDLRKYIWHTLTFFAVIFLIGSLNQGSNTHITFAWMFHQGDLAQGQFDPFNFLSYPYYLFRLESVLFGLLFFGNIYFFVKRKWTKLFPFALVCFQMLLFSFAQEKGVRYLCNTMPLMAIAVSLIIADLWQDYKALFSRWIIVGLGALLIMNHLAKANAIIHFHTDYESSMQDLLTIKRDVKVLSTQSMIQKLFVPQDKNVIDPPTQTQYLMALYAKGYHYLIIDPQAYVSFTEDGQRFTPQLKSYLGFIQKQVKPIKIYPHFNPALLERFVLEHNENLRRSLTFLSHNQRGQLGALRVYDLRECLLLLSAKGHSRE